MFGESAGGFFGNQRLFSLRFEFGGYADQLEISDVLFQVRSRLPRDNCFRGLSERTRLRGYLFYSGLIVLSCTRSAAHWVWQGGWLARLGAIDFAGASVVHSLAGWVSLAAVLVLVPPWPLQSRRFFRRHRGA